MTLKPNAPATSVGWVVLPDQLFAIDYLKNTYIERILYREDENLIAYERFHHQRIIFCVAAMRHHAEDMVAAGYTVDYQPLAHAPEGFAYHVAAWAKTHKLTQIHTFEIVDRHERKLFKQAMKSAEMMWIAHPSPMFLTSNERFSAYLQDSKRPFMKTFYELQRKRLNILIHPDERPMGGKWSFDEENRQPLPPHVALPDVPKVALDRHIQDAQALCQAQFPTFPGVNTTPWLPCTRKGALAWLEDFLATRFHNFGPYEDALSRRGEVLFHSVLTPFLNSGLLTPQEVIEKAQRVARQESVPIASLEGFLRQIIGWREFVRGIYENFDEQQQQRNFFNHTKKLTPHWWRGDTGIPPLDDTLAKVCKLGWAHHIERLMVVGNLMLLLEVQPHEAHRWFMEMFVDSARWVMGPNVYGMALFSDGGIFATKPYICGSNYYRKMGKYPKGPWCDGVDGLYWRFIEKHKNYLAKNARMHFAVRTVETMAQERKDRLFDAAKVLQSRLTSD